MDSRLLTAGMTGVVTAGMTTYSVIPAKAGIQQ